MRELVSFAHRDEGSAVCDPYVALHLAISDLIQYSTKMFIFLLTKTIRGVLIKTNKRNLLKEYLKVMLYDKLQFGSPLVYSACLVLNDKYSA